MASNEGRDPGEDRAPVMTSFGKTLSPKIAPLPPLSNKRWMISSSRRRLKLSGPQDRCSTRICTTRTAPSYSRG